MIHLEKTALKRVGFVLMENHATTLTEPARTGVTLDFKDRTVLKVIQSVA